MLRDPSPRDPNNPNTVDEVRKFSRQDSKISVSSMRRSSGISMASSGQGTARSRRSDTAGQHGSKTESFSSRNLSIITEQLIKESANKSKQFVVYRKWQEALQDAAQLPRQDVELTDSKAPHLLLEDLTKNIASLCDEDRDKLAALLQDLRREAASGSSRKDLSASSMGTLNNKSVDRGKRLSSVLHKAAKAGSAHDIKRLLTTEDTMLDVDSKDVLGQTALHYAATSSSEEAVAELIALGADVNTEDDFGETPLNRACTRFKDANHPIVRMLVLKGADINHKDKTGRTPLDILGDDLLLVKEGKDFPSRRSSTLSIISSKVLPLNERVNACGALVWEKCLAALKQYGLGEGHAQQVLHVTMLKAQEPPSAVLHGIPSSEAQHVMAPLLKDRYRGCLIGVALGDAIGLACEGRTVASLKELNQMLGGSFGCIEEQYLATGRVTLEVIAGDMGLEIGSWSEWGAACLCAAESAVALTRHDPVDVMIRLLKMQRTGSGSCRPSRCSGMDPSTRAGLDALERHGWRAGYLPRSSTGFAHAATSSSALSRVAPIVMLLAADPLKCITTAGDSTRSTHDHVVCVDAARYLASILCGVLTTHAHLHASEAKSKVLELRFTPVPDLWMSKPLARDVREVADGTFLKETTGGVTPLEFQTAAGALSLAMWALQRSDNVVSGLDLLLSVQAGRGALAVYCSLAGALYGGSELPDVWIHMLAKEDRWVTLADSLFEASRPGAQRMADADAVD